MFTRITIIGLGLIGGSIARAAREHQLAEIIVGCDNSEAALNFAKSLGVIDIPTHDPQMAVSKSNLVIIATPPSAFESLTRAIAPRLEQGTIVTDTGSIKRAALQSIGAHLPDHVDYIPSHPIAGNERTGITASSADLFQKKLVIVTPNEPILSDALQSITSFWKKLGARVEGMPPELHDTIYAYVSHLPHLLAYAANSIFTPEDADSLLLKTFLRLGRSNADLWSELFYLNQDNILAALNRYMDATAHIERELKQAPKEVAAKDSNGTIARTVLFPRIAASCLITTVMEAEKTSGVPFARFAGSGFLDFTSPASIVPEDDIEATSNYHKEVAAILGEYNRKLAEMHDLLSRHQHRELAQVLSRK